MLGAEFMVSRYKPTKVMDILNHG